MKPDKRLSQRQSKLKLERRYPMSIDLSRQFKRPEGHHTITSSFVVPNAGKVIEFVQRAFGAELVERYDGPGGAVMHAELRIGDTAIMLGDPQPGFDAMPAALSLYV